MPQPVLETDRTLTVLSKLAVEEIPFTSQCIVWHKRLVHPRRLSGPHWIQRVGILLPLIIHNRSNDSMIWASSASLCTIGSNRNLNKCGQAWGLGNYINRHRGCINGIIPQRTMSATVEALIGAVFIDSKHSLSYVKIAMKSLGLI